MTIEHYAKAWRDTLEYCRRYGFCTRKDKWMWYEKQMVMEIYDKRKTII